MQHRDGATVMPGDNRSGSPESFSLLQLRAGETLEIQTGSSVYWVTRLSGSHLTLSRGHERKLIGVSVQTNSTTFGQITRSPQEVYVSATVRVGQEFYINSGHTACVRSFRVL